MDLDDLTGGDWHLAPRNWALRGLDATPRKEVGGAGGGSGPRMRGATPVPAPVPVPAPAAPPPGREGWTAPAAPAASPPPPAGAATALPPPPPGYSPPPDAAPAEDVAPIELGPPPGAFGDMGGPPLYPSLPPPSPSPVPVTPFPKKQEKSPSFIPFLELLALLGAVLWS